MIYFLFPVYNEEANLSGLIKSIREKMKGQNYQMIAVNDGSTDNSLALLEQCRGKDLKVVGSVINMNIGAVFSTGIAEVLSTAGDQDIMFILESDQTSEIDLIVDMIEKIKTGQDIVIASRYQAGGKYERFPWMRKIFSLGASSMMKYYFPIKNVNDYTIFFRAYRVGILKKAAQYFGMFGLIQSKGFVANAELLIKLSWFTDKIAEVPFVYDYGRKKGKSKIRILMTINEYFVLVNYLKRLFNKFKKVSCLSEGLVS
ncbi:MAG: glycosyltransferase [Candidatus Omnitrophica bacterium]|nr:glycosyltransferase [Candidatus Omnitrophota bacterium]